MSFVSLIDMNAKLCDVALVAVQVDPDMPSPSKPEYK